MTLLKKIMTIILIITILSLIFPASGFSEQKQGGTKITKHDPKFLTTPEIKIPVEKVEKKKMSKWVWVGLGALAVGAAAAGGGGGGGGDDGDGGEVTSGETGNVEVTW